MTDTSSGGNMSEPNDGGESSLVPSEDGPASECAADDGSLPDVLPGRRDARIFLGLLALFGALSVFFVPPGQVLDEPAHWARVWKLSGGHLVSDVERDEATGYDVSAATYPACVQEYVNGLSDTARKPIPLRVSDYWAEPAGCRDRPSVRVVGEPTGPYSIWSYPGQTGGVLAGRLLGLPLPGVFFLGRLAGLCFYAALTSFAIRRAPRGRHLLTFVGLAPIAVMGAGGYSADGVVVGSMILAAAFAIRFREPEYRMARSELVILAAAMLALCLTKPTYIFVLALFACYQPTALGSRTRTMRTLGGLAASVVVLAVLWNRLSTPAEALSIYRPGTLDQSGQTRWIMSHPFDFLGVVVRSFLDPWMQNVSLHSWISWFSMSRTGSSSDPFLPPILSMFASGAVAAFTIGEMGTRRALGRAANRVRSYLPELVILAAFITIYATLYIAWSSVGASKADGVQGRYFLPLVPLAVVGAVMRRERPGRQLSWTSAVVASGVLLVASVVKAVTFYY